jgi:hypothetical protein
MTVTFDGANRRIICQPGTTSLDVKSDLYSAWKVWVIQGSNARFPPAFRAVGGDPTVAGQALGSTFFLTNGWRIRPQEADHTLAITGNLYTEEGDDPIVPTTGSWRILVRINNTNLIDQVQTGGGSGGGNTASEIASAVWNAPVASYSNAGTFGSFVQNGLLTVAKFLGLK